MKTPHDIMMQSAYQIPGWCYPRELHALFNLAKDSSCHIEIGVYCGKSAWVTGHAMAEGGVLHLVDPMEFEGGIQNVPGFAVPCNAWPSEVLDSTLRALCLERPNLQIRQHRVVSLTAAVQLAKNGVQAETIYVDAGHTMEDVQGDIEAFLPLLKEGGKMYGHDYWARDFGVIDAVNECFCDDFYVIENTRIWVHEKLAA